MANFEISELKRQLLLGEKTIQEISSYLPCYLHINSLKDFSVLESDIKIQNYFDLPLSEINKQGFSLLEKHVHPEDLKNAVMVNQEYLKNKEQQTHVSFLQRVNFYTSKDYELFYTRGQVLDEERILNLSVPTEQFELFNYDILNLFENASYIKNNLYKYDLLTKRELLICKYLCQEGSLKTISEAIGISKNTVNNHKINIYKKLEVNNYFDFYFFCSKFKIHE